jgi:hypothetical protein
MMPYQMQYAFVAVAMLAMTAMGNPVFATPPGAGPSATLAQAQQPATPTPAPAPQAPAAGAQQQPSGTSTTMPSQMMEHGKGMGEMGKEMGPMGGQGQPGPMGGMPPCSPGQTASGTPPTCR